jgi:hypothetical protein
MDYSIFDNFCRRPTWHTTHPSDEKLFSAALRQANQNPDFSPEEMGRYIRQYGSDAIWPRTGADVEASVRRLVKRAEAAKSRKSSSRFF